MASHYPAYGAPQPNANVYPYPPAASYPSEHDFHSTTRTAVNPDKNEGYARHITRTPSPTPSEQAELQRKGVVDWRALTNWRYWFRRDLIWYYVGLLIITALAALVTIYHKDIINWLMPAANWMRDLKFGWLIPIGIFFVISFPPLFGHEIVAILCGLVWGLGLGFAIVAAGTFIGELGNFYAFKYCCRARGEKLERTQISYACLARVVREGGFKIALVARFSAIPGHFTTAVFSTCGMGVFVFSLAAMLSLPKQFITVYLGVIIEQADRGGGIDTKTRIIDYAVIGGTSLVTLLAMWYIYYEMNKVKPEVIYQRRKARQAKLAASDSSYFTPGSSVMAFNPNQSETNIPLNPYGEPAYQQWDASGRAVGYAGDPRLFAPQPQRQYSGPTSQFSQDAQKTPYKPVRAGSGDDGGWESGSSEDSHTLEGPAMDEHFARTGSPPQMTNYMPPPHAPPQGRRQSDPPFAQYPTGTPRDRSQTTPTQAQQFATYQNAANDAPAPLPTPTYQQTFSPSQPPMQPQWQHAPQGQPEYLAYAQPQGYHHAPRRRMRRSIPRIGGHSRGPTEDAPGQYYGVAR